MKPKYRYNVETKEWDILLSPYDYDRLIKELEMLRQIVSRQIQPFPGILPIAPPQPNIYPTPDAYKSPFWYGELGPRSKCGNSICNCSGACRNDSITNQKYIVTNLPQNFCSML